MTAPRPTGSIDIWNFVDNVTGTTVRKWLRDSWARRKIVALQQAVAAIVVPTKTSQLQNDSGFITQADVPPGSTASSTTPLMDGTAAVGTETAFARGDHRHPTDTSRQAALSTAQMAAVNSGVTAAKVAAWDGITVPTKTSELINDSGFITSVPVQSVNGQTGVVSLDAADVGALPDSTVIPSKTSQLTNDSGYITAAPVTSVNGKTGAVSLDASDVGALPDTTTIPSKTSDLTNDSGYITSSDIPSVPSASTTSPKMDGTASAGSSGTWSRGDHVHPHDTTKADKATTLAGYGITNAYTKTEVDGMIPTVPTNVSAFINDAGYITSAPVASVNGQTGAVNLSASDVGAQDTLTAAQLAAVDSGITAEKVASYEQTTALTLTRVENAYVNATNFARLQCYKIGPHFAILHLNLRLNAKLSGTSFVTIGNVTGVSLPYQHFTTVQSDDASGMLAIQVNETGAIRIYSSSAPASKWYRTEIPLLLN